MGFYSQETNGMIPEKDIRQIKSTIMAAEISGNSLFIEKLGVYTGAYSQHTPAVFYLFVNHFPSTSNDNNVLIIRLQRYRYESLHLIKML